MDNFINVLQAAFAPVDLCRSSGIQHRVYIVIVGCSFKFFALVELGTILLMKWKIVLRAQRCAESLASSADGLMKFDLFSLFR
jgi:hypothetical protein